MSYLTPRKSVSAGFEGEKLDSIIAQDNAQIAYNIGENTEIRGFVVKGANMDLYVDEAVRQGKQYTYNTTNGTLSKSKAMVESNNKTSKALVLTHYPSWGKIKFIYSDGYDMNGYINNGKLTSDTTTRTNYTTYNISRSYALAKAKAYGATVEFNKGAFTYGAEVLRVKSKTSLFTYSSHGQTSNVDATYKAYNDYIISNNSGKLAIPITYDVASLSVGYKKGKWSVYGNALAIKQKYTGVGKKAYDLSVKASINTGSAEKTVYAGGITASYKLDENGDKTISAFGGAMSSLAGVGIGYNQRINDNLSLGLSAISGELFGAANIADAIGGDDYKEKSGSETFFGISLNYKL